MPGRTPNWKCPGCGVEKYVPPCQPLKTCAKCIPRGLKPNWECPICGKKQYVTPYHQTGRKMCGDCRRKLKAWPSRCGPATEGMLEGIKSRAIERKAAAQETKQCYTCGVDIIRPRHKFSRSNRWFCSPECRSSTASKEYRVNRILKVGGNPTDDKICGRCHLLKSRKVDFHVDRRTGDGLNSICKLCQKLRQEDKYREIATNPDKKIQRQNYVRNYQRQKALRTLIRDFNDTTKPDNQT